MSLSDQLIASGRKLLINNYGRAPIVMSRGEGCVLWDADGQRYLDMTAGIAVCILGHGHQGLTQAIAQQAARLHHTSNLYFIEAQIRLAEALAKRAFAGKMFFCNSGTDLLTGISPGAAGMVTCATTSGRFSAASMLCSSSRTEVKY